MKAREYWLDYLRAFACILVTVGHLLMSLQDSQIIRQSVGVTTFVGLIYFFHVYIFFFCSGYLFQASKNSAVYSLRYRIEKCVNFLMLYVVFTCITYFMKIVFSTTVNSAVEDTLLDTLLKYPVNQMWYLYAISVVFLFSTFIASDKVAYTILGVAIFFKLLCVWDVDWLLPLPASYLLQNMIWFVLGQFFAYKQIKLSTRSTLLLALLFVVAFVYRCVFDFAIGFCDEMLTLLGITASAGIVYNLTRNKTAVTGMWKYLSKYMLQIYLLHTIFAAGIRVVLLKFGITAVVPHVLLGIIFSFVMPILCAMIAERITLLNFFFFPLQTIKKFVLRKRFFK